YSNKTLARPHKTAGALVLNILNTYRSKRDVTMVTTEDFLRFWEKVKPSLHIHPDDAMALKSHRHALELGALVGPFMGPVRSAPVVLLTLNGGFNGAEIAEAKVQSARDEMAYNLGGNAPLPTFATNPKGRVWAEARLRQFGLNYQNAGSKVAFINLIPYRSSEGSKDKKRMIPHLASSRIVLAWACDTLFREAESGKRVVV